MSSNNRINTIAAVVAAIATVVQAITDVIPFLPSLRKDVDQQDIFLPPESITEEDVDQQDIFLPPESQKSINSR